MMGSTYLGIGDCGAKRWGGKEQADTERQVPNRQAWG